MAESPFTDSAVLFGGVSGGVYREDTWTFDGTTKTWTERHPSTHPPARIDAAMAWDSNGKVILFGGKDATGQLLGDTWEYDVITNQWALGTTSGPPARDQAAMAFDNGMALLFGGADVHGWPLDDTWSYMSESNSWMQWYPGTKPSARSRASMSSSENIGLAGSGHRGAVLFGGWTWDGWMNDTWTWNMGSWVKQAPAASPSAREDAAMGFDPVHRHLVLYGGYAGSHLSDTWTYDGATWTQASPIGNPPTLYFGGSLVTANWTTGETVLFGLGSSDAWVYRTADPPSAPTGLTATSGDGQAQFSWAVPASDGGRAIQGYNVYVGATSGGESGTPANGGTLVTGTSYTLTGLTNGTYYWVYVKAVNDAGLSPPSMEAAAKPRAPGSVEGTWIPLSPPVAPSGRDLASIAESPFTGDTVLFGGTNASTQFNDTWTYDNTTMTWTQWTSAQTPPARYGAAMAYDARYDMIVLFGGYNFSTGILGDTWVFDPHTHQWTQKSPVNHPSARHRAVMSASSDGVILFGGEVPGYGGGNLADTWLYNSHDDTWTQQAPAASPSARYGASMASAYRSLSASAGYYGPVLFGGQTGPNVNPTVVNDTWTYEWLGPGNWSWVQQSPTSAPPARSLAAMGYDPVKRQMVLFGGLVPATLTRLADTWTYDGRTWLPATADRSPSARVGAVLAASDWPTGPMVLFGGNTGGYGYMNDTWIYGPPPPPVVVDDAYTTNEDTVLSVAAPGVLGNDSTLTGSLTVDSWTDPAHGTLATNANGSFTYTPPANWNGTVSFAYTARGAGGTTTASVTITVTSVPDADTAVADTYTTRQDTPLVVSAPGVLTNDVDLDGDGKQVNVSATTNPAHGSRSISADGSFTYTPASGWFGTDSFTYRLASSTSTATVSITVIEGYPPDTTITAGPPTATQDSAATFAFTGTDNVTPAAGLTFQCSLDGAAFADCTSPTGYTGLAAGPHTFEVKATDAAGNVDPTPALWAWAVDLTPPDTTILSGPTQPTTPRTDAVFTFTGTDNVTAAGGLTFSCRLDSGAFASCMSPKTYTGLAYGPHIFEVKATDGAGNEDPTAAAYSWVALDTGNSAPVAVDDTYTVVEDNGLTVAAATGVLANDTDADGLGTLSVLAFSGATAHGSVALSADGAFVYTPEPNYAGTDTFTYDASDGITEDQATVTITVEAVNDPPVAVGNAYTVVEDQTLTRAAPGLLANDADTEGNVLSAVLVSGPSHAASFTLNADGSFTYTPAANFNGADSFTYQASDGTASSNVATVSITIDPYPDDPVPVDDAYTVAAGAVLTVTKPGIFANDIDIDGSGFSDALIYVTPTHGLLDSDWTVDGSFLYVPQAGFQGVDTFKYSVCDNNGWCSPWEQMATVTITVTGANAAPVAAADTYTATEDQPSTTADPGVLANDTDADGNALSAVLVSGPSHADSFTLNADGSFTYTPAADFNGTDTFTYRASDNMTTSNLATVTITVNAVNDAPVANADTYVTGEDEALGVAAPGLLGNDTDVDSGSLAVVVVTPPAHGTVVTGEGGAFVYTPAAGFHGTDPFTYRASDGTATSGVVTVTITVTPINDPPVGVADEYSVTEDQTLSVDAPGILANDSDPDGDALSPAAMTAPAHGTLSVYADGSFTYTPAANYHGPDSFTYKAYDGKATSEVVTVSITVNQVFDDILAGGDAFSVPEDGSLTVPVPGVLGNDTNPEGGTLTAFLLSWDPPTPVTGGWSMATAHGTVTLYADGSFAYIPAADYHGTDRFYYRAEIRDGEVLRGFSASVTVTITVTPTNDPPLGVADEYSVNEDTTLSVDAPGILANDSDPDGDTLSPAAMTAPAHGTLSVYADGSFAYTPAVNYFGADSFTYKAHDGTATSDPVTVTITVNARPDAPAATDDHYSVAEDQTLTVAAAGVLANDASPDGDPLSALLLVYGTPVAVSGGWSYATAHGSVTLYTDGSFTYVPAADFSGTDGFLYRAEVRDGEMLRSYSPPATVWITVTAVPDAPVGVPDEYLVDEDTTLSVEAAAGVLANDSDADGDEMWPGATTAPAHGSLAVHPDGSFTYTPAPNYNGPDSFTYQAVDATGAASEVVTVTITVTPVFDMIVANDDAYTVDEDSTLTVKASGVLADDSNPDGGTVTAFLLTGPDHGALTLNSDGSFTYTPAAGYNGSDAFLYRAEVRDGEVLRGYSPPATVELTVTPVNDPPVGVPDGYSVDEDTTLSVDATAGVLANDSDPDADALSAQLVTGPANGMLVFDAVGSFLFTPAAEYNGPDSFTYRAVDGTGATSEVITVTITVNSVNDPPVAAADAYSVDEDASLTIVAAGVLANDTHPDADPPTAVLAGGPTHGAVVLNPDGSFGYVPAANFNGIDTFTYKAADAEPALSAETAVTITVNSVNDVPVPATDAYSTDEDTPLTVGAPGVLGNDAHPDAHASIALLKNGPANGALTLYPDGSFTYKPAADYDGLDSFTYAASDSEGTSEPVTVSLTVNAVNDPPAVPAAGVFDVGATEPIPSGGHTVSSTVVFRAPVSDPENSMVRLVIEVEPASEAFDLAGEYRSDPVASGGTAEVTVTGLTPGPHHWQAWTEDAEGLVSEPAAGTSFEVHAATTLLYNGAQLVYLGGSFTPAARLSSPAPACVAGQTVLFGLDDNPTTEAIDDGSYSLGEGTTGSTGLATAPDVSTDGWQPGVYTVRANFKETDSCEFSSDEATLTVADPGDSATGGGWYTLGSDSTGAGRVNFGFTVHKIPGTDPPQYKGQFLLINNGKWRLKGVLDSYAQIGVNGSAAGTGNLYAWDATLNLGAGGWTLAATDVPFTISFADNGSGKRTKTSVADTFGIHIDDTGGSLPLPNSAPQPIKGGNIRIGPAPTTPPPTGGGGKKK